MEDGCSKRFDIETVDFRPQNYSLNEQNPLRVTSRLPDSQSRQPSFSSSAHYSPPPGNSTSQGIQEGPLTSVSGQFLERHEYNAGGSNHDSVWSN